MIKTLQFGGGILSVKPSYLDSTFEDFGFCDGLSLNIKYEEEFRDKYVRGVGSRIIRVKSSEGFLQVVQMSGRFVCESITRSKLQSLWFKGSASSSGTELLQGNNLEPFISAIKFVSVSNFGPIECVNLPKVSLMIDERKLMGYEWRNLPYTFEVFIEEGYIPTLRVQQEGESIIGFCE